MIMKKIRRELTVEDVFTKPKYRTLWGLIVKFSADPKHKLKFFHLRYALCKNNGGIKLDDEKEKEIIDYFYPYRKQVEKEHIKMYEKGLISKKDLQELLIPHKINIVLEENENYEFSSFQTLGNALSRMKKLGLIDNNQDGYTVTEKGMALFNRFYIHWYIEEYIPDDSKKLEEIKKCIMGK